MTNRVYPHPALGGHSVLYSVRANRACCVPANQQWPDTGPANKMMYQEIQEPMDDIWELLSGQREQYGGL